MVLSSTVSSQGPLWVGRWPMFFNSSLDTTASHEEEEVSSCTLPNRTMVLPVLFLSDRIRNSSVCRDVVVRLSWFSTFLLLTSWWSQSSMPVSAFTVRMTAMTMMPHHHDDPQVFQTIDIPPSHSIQRAKNPLTSRWIQLIPWVNDHHPNRHRPTRTSTTTTAKTTTPEMTTRAAVTSSVWQSFVEQGGWMVHRGDIVRLWQPPPQLPLRDKPVPTTPTTNHSSSLPQWYILEPTLVEPPPLPPSPPCNQTGALDHATMQPPKPTGTITPDYQSLPHARDLLWLYKPDGLLTLPGKTEPDCLATQVNQFLLEQRQQSANGTRRNNQYNNNNNKPKGNQKLPWIPRPCHRLDRDTSGIIVMAKTKDAYTALSKQFEQRYVKKQYVALVHGWIKQDSGMIDQPIGETKKTQRRQQQDDGGGDSYKVWTTDPGADKIRPAITYYQVSRRYRPTTPTENGPHNDGTNHPSDELDDHTTTRTSSYTRIVLQPQTGRGHQLRLHMAKVLGCPILGDTLHDSAVGGDGVAPRGRDPDHDNHGPSSPRIVAPRLCLHAEYLQVWVLDEHDQVRQAKCWCLPPF